MNEVVTALLHGGLDRQRGCDRSVAVFGTCSLDCDESADEHQGGGTQGEKTAFLGHIASLLSLTGNLPERAARAEWTG